MKTVAIGRHRHELIQCAKTKKKKTPRQMKVQTVHSNWQQNKLLVKNTNTHTHIRIVAYCHSNMTKGIFFFFIYFIQLAQFEYRNVVSIVKTEILAREIWFRFLFFFFLHLSISSSSIGLTIDLHCRRLTAVATIRLR